MTLFHMLAAGFLTLFFGILLLMLYRRAVGRYMRVVSDMPPGYSAQSARERALSVRSALTLDIQEPTASSRKVRFQSASFVAADRAMTWAAVVYAVAGTVHALITIVVLFVLQRHEFLPGRFMAMALAHAWPVILTLFLLWGRERGRQWKLLTAYLAGFAVIGLILALIGGSTPTAVAGGRITIPVVAMPAFLGLLNAAPSAFLLLFLNRRMRAIGPILFLMLLIAAIGPFLVNGPGVNFHLAAAVLLIESGSGAVIALFASQLLALLVFLGPAWLVARWVARQYRRKRFSEQTLTFSAVWLFMSVFQSITLAHGEQTPLGGLALGAFATYL